MSLYAIRYCRPICLSFTSPLSHSSLYYYETPAVPVYSYHNDRHARRCLALLRYAPLCSRFQSTINYSPSSLTICHLVVFPSPYSSLFVIPCSTALPVRYVIRIAPTEPHGTMNQNGRGLSNVFACICASYIRTVVLVSRSFPTIVPTSPVHVPVDCRMTAASVGTSTEARLLCMSRYRCSHVPDLLARTRAAAPRARI